MNRQTVLSPRSQVKPRPAARPAQHRYWRPPLEWENGNNAFILRWQLPGISPDNIDLQLSARNLSLRAWRPSATGHILWSDWPRGEFRRTVELPAPVDVDRAIADFKDGILTVTLPKLAISRPAVVNISLNPNRKANSTEADFQPDKREAEVEMSEAIALPSDEAVAAAATDDLTADLWG